MSLYKILIKLDVCIFNKRLKILEKYEVLGEKVTNIIKKEFNSEPGHNMKYLKAGKNQRRRMLSM